MSNYSKVTNFTSKDALATGNPSKIIKGSEFDTEFDAIATSIATKLDSSGSAANLTDHKFVQRVEATPYTTQGSDNTLVPLDGTIPQQTEMGGPYCTATITPTKSTNRLVIQGHMTLGSNTSNTAVVGVFQDSVANGLAFSAIGFPSASFLAVVPIYHEMEAGTTTATSFKLKLGVNTDAVFVNRTSNIAALFGGVLNCRLSVTEVES